MKQVTDLDVKHVVSEPGDATRYDYIVIPGEETFKFFPYSNTFRYPTEIGVWQDENDVKWLAEKYACSPHTVEECLRTIKEIRHERLV